MDPRPQLSNLAAVATDVKAWDAVALLGAGISVAARLPMRASLDSLVSEALEADPEALSNLQGRAHLPGLSAKATVERLGAENRHAWAAVATHATARARFQLGFADLDAERRGRFSPAHDALAEMLHRRELELVISLNWDTQLESAWSARYGQPQSICQRLVKPHGDAARPEEPWTLPGEDRALARVLDRRLAALVAERPRVLMIVGYSETDEPIVQQLIAPLEERWKVVRIGPNASGPLALRASADTALPRLRRAIDSGPETLAWSYVHFDPQHDLGSALSGRGLGTHDVAACPAVPEVSTAVAELRATGSVTIIGESGAGKSLAAAHVAHCFWSEGFEVVGLTDYSTDPSQLRQSLLGLPRPLVAVLDDAQGLPPTTRRELLASGGNGLCVIAVLNGPLAGEPGVRLDSVRATALFEAFIRANRPAVLRTVHALDPHVGDGPLDEPLERRLAQAVKVATSPWQLAYVLTGGWRRVRGDVAELRAAGGYDLALALVAIVQQLRMGSAAKETELRELAGAVDRDEGWLRAALAQALEKRLLIRDRSTFRLPHLRFTRVMFELALTGATRKPLLDAVRAAIDRGGYELSGIHWLLYELFFADQSLRPKRAQLPLQVAEHLVARCWAASGGQRGAASFVLNDVRRLQPEAVELREHAALLGKWISQAKPPAMPGLARLLNDTHNEDPDLLEPICSHVDVAALARSFEASSWPEPYFFGEIFSRLGLGPQAFCDAMATELDRNAVTALFGQWPAADDADLYDLAKALSGIASFDFDLALERCEDLALRIAERWQERFAEGYSDLMDILFLLGFGPAFLRQRQPTRRQRRIARKLCEGLEPARVASEISRSTQREWKGVGEGLVLVGEASPRQAKRITRLVDFEKLDASTAEFWPRRVEVLRSLLVGLAHGPNHEPASMWVARHAPEMLRVDTLAATLAPKACAKRLLELGAVVDLSRPGSDWGTTALALQGIAGTEPEVARRSVVVYRRAFVEAFGEAFEFERAEPVVRILEELDISELRSAVGAIDPTKARERWALVLRDKPVAARRVVARLVAIALETDGPMSGVALELRRRFPGATRCG